MDKIRFPIKIEKVKRHSAEYLRLKKEIDQLRAKFYEWVRQIDRRIAALEKRKVL